MARALRRRARPAKGLALAATAAMLVSCVLVASSIAPVALAARDLTDSTACESCLVAAHILYDAIGDPYVETKMAQFLIDSICPNFDDKKSCEENVNNLVGALVEWMRVNLEPDALCASAGVCAGGGGTTSPPLPLLPPLPPQLSALLFPSTATNTKNGPKDISCPLCMFVLTKIKDALSDPITRQKVHDAGIKACAALPEGAGVRDACVDFVERNEAEIYDYVDKSEPAQLCERLAACPAPSSPSSPSSLLGAAHLAAELARGVLAGGADAGGAQLAAFPSSSSSSSPTSPALARLSSPLRTLSDGNCDACMAVVKDLHSAVASPQVQDQATAAAKTACAALEKAGTADLAERCRAGVDQYAPLVFGMALAYLQPASLCAQVGLCPPPSLSMVAAPSSASSSASLLVLSDGSGSVGGSLAVQIAAVAEEVVREVEAAVIQAEAVLGGVATLQQQVEEQQQQQQQPPVEEDARVAVS